MEMLGYQPQQSTPPGEQAPIIDTLANARRQVRKLSHGGREALLRALLEQLEREPGTGNAPAAAAAPVALIAPGKDRVPAWRPSPPLASSPSMPSLTSSPTSDVPSYFPSFKSTPRTSGSSAGSWHSIRKSLIPSPLNVTKEIHELPSPPPPTSSTFVKPAPSRKTSKTRAPARVVEALSPTSTSHSSTRAYWCVYCGDKFDHKFEWKRHDEEVHEQPRQYPCPSRSCRQMFYSAHSFNMHHRTAHGCLTCPHDEKVVRRCKPKRAWGCGFCAAFLGSLDRYHEHVALHFESGKTLAHWHHEHVIYGLLHQPVIHPMWKSLQAAKSVNSSHEYKPKLSWDKESTGRTPGFSQAALDAPGQLQDLLEFFDPTYHRADVIVKLADDHAIYVNLFVEEDPVAGKAGMATAAGTQTEYRPEPVEDSNSNGKGKGKSKATTIVRPASMAFQSSQWATVQSNIPPAESGPSRPPHMRSNSLSDSSTSQRVSERPLPRVVSQMYQPSMLRRPTVDGSTTVTSRQAVPTRPPPGLDISPVSKDESDSFSDWNSMADTCVDGPMTPLMSPRRTMGFAATNPFRQAPPLPPLPSEWMAR